MTALALTMAGLSLPFVAGQALEIGDELGMDATGERGAARMGIRGALNMAGTRGIHGATQRSLDEELENMLKIHGQPESGQFASNNLGNADSQFLNQLFASQGMRMAGVAQQAEKMTYMDTASSAGII